MRINTSSGPVDSVVCVGTEEERGCPGDTESGADVSHARPSGGFHSEQKGSDHKPQIAHSWRDYTSGQGRVVIPVWACLQF